MYLKYIDEQNKQNSFQTDKIPDKCPVCDQGGTPDFISARFISFNEKKERSIGAVFQCPFHKCNQLYIAIYLETGHGTTQFILLETALTKYVKKIHVPNNICKLSESFVKTYIDSNIAEQNQLNEISGCGYRRALEFLIKDYLKYLNKENAEKIKEIEGKFLGRCIEEDISDTRIKAMAKRAAWLGNDQTHYVKRWENHDLQDLKRLIDITVSFINTELLASEYLNEMPDK